jgi:hypothetical protein
MQLGVVFSQTETGADVGAIREDAMTVQGLGYRRILAYDDLTAR